MVETGKEGRKRKVGRQERLGRLLGLVGETTGKWLGWKKDGWLPSRRDVMEQWVGGCRID